MFALISSAVATLLAVVMSGCGGDDGGGGGGGGGGGSDLPQGSDFIKGANKPESAVQVGSSIFVSSMVEEGGVNKYLADGSMDNSFSHIRNLKNPRGLAAKKTEDKLWVAHDGGVSEYTLGGSSASFVRTYVLGSNMAEPNGLCLDDDETSLFVTQPGWKARPWGASGVNGLAKIDLASGGVTKLFENAPGHTPNGCLVEGGTIWMMNQKDGVTSFDWQTNTGKTPIAWSDEVKKYQSGEKAGDGIVLYQGKFYVSSWKPPSGPGGSPEGRIHVCDPSLTSNQCVEMANEVACDMQLGEPASAPVLFLPSLTSGTVKKLALPVSSIIEVV